VKGLHHGKKALEGKNSPSTGEPPLEGKKLIFKGDQHPLAGKKFEEEETFPIQVEGKASLLHGRVGLQ